MSTVAKSPQTPKSHDALEFLASRHKAVLGLVRDYDRDVKKADSVEKGKAALRLCHQLKIDCAIKEEIFYPAALVALGEKAEDSLKGAQGLLGSLRGLMNRIEGMQAKDGEFDAAVKRLGEVARQQFEAEEADVHPKLRHGKFDLAGTGEKLAARRLQLSTEPAGKLVIQEARRVLGD